MDSGLNLRSLFQPAPQPEINLGETVNDSTIVRYAIVATLALQVFDYISNLDDEIRFVWLWERSESFYQRIPFFINRYLPFLTLSSSVYFTIFLSNQDMCRPAHLIVGLVALTGAIMAEFTLFIRTYAIYERNKIVLALLVILLFVTSVIAFLDTTYYISQSLVLQIGVAHKGCLFWYKLKIMWISLIALVICESVAFCLLLAKAFWYWKHSGSYVMMHICKDGIFYFVCIIGSTIVNLSLQVFASNLLCDALLIPQSVIHQILCVHFILRIRRFSEDNTLLVNRPEAGHSFGSLPKTSQV